MQVRRLEQALDPGLARRDGRRFRRGSALLAAQHGLCGYSGGQRRRRADELSTSDRHKVLPVERMVGEPSTVVVCRRGDRKDAKITERISSRPLLGSRQQRRKGMTLTRSIMMATVAIVFGVAGGLGANAQNQPARAAEPRPTRNPLEGNAQAIGNGKAMFRTRCAGCHGPDARGYLGPDLT